MGPNDAALIDHYRNPRYTGAVADPDHRHEIFNQKCGDQLRFTAKLKGNRLSEVRFEGEGCFYCLVSASVACLICSGQDKGRVANLVGEVRNWLKEESGNQKPDNPLILALGEVKKYPMRIDCVDLAWKGIGEMLKKH